MRLAAKFLHLQRRSKRELLFIFAVCTCSIFIYFIFVMRENEISFGFVDDIDLSDYPLFEPILTEDFPSTDQSVTRIPRQIHQTWKDIYVPREFHANVQSFVKYNPGYRYYFWTDAAARELIAERHPQLLETFDNYVEPVRKADMLRYVVLYEFGGIYADLDTECLRPLDRVLVKYACIISPEPFEHSTLIYNTRFMVTNSVLFCQQHHPFLHKLMYNLPSFSHFSQDIDASGPNYVTLQLNIYKKDLIQPGQKLTELNNKDVYVPSSQYFQYQIDPVRFDQFKRMCRQFRTLNDIARSGCVSLKQKGLVRRIGRFEFTRHSFYHTGYKWIPESNTKITDLVEHVTMYKSR